MAAHPRASRATDVEIVDLYRIAYNADHPLTLVELVDGMPSAYQNDANRAYAKHRDEAGDDPRPEPWSQRQRRTALEWWVGEVLSSAHKHFLSRTQDGSPARGKRRADLLYTANRDRPPTVMEQILISRPARWTPEIGATGRRHVAGMKFRAKLAEIEALGHYESGQSKGKLKANKDDLEAALLLAAEALAVPTPESK